MFRFKKPFKYQAYEISGFELVEPKEGQISKSELDHLEFVIKESFESFMKKTKSVNWELRAKDRKDFPKISILLDNGKSIRFHLKNIFEEIPK